MIAPAGHHCNVRSGHLNATFGGKDMGSMAQTGLLLVPSDALGHTWALPGVLGTGQGLPPETGTKNLKNERSDSTSQGEGASQQHHEGEEPMTKAQRKRERQRKEGPPRKPRDDFRRRRADQPY